jgi:hypothetical protein
MGECNNAPCSNMPLNVNGFDRGLLMADVKIYATVIEEEAKEQIQLLARQI